MVFESDVCQGEGCPSAKVPITLTHVLYDRGELLGRALQLASSAGHVTSELPPPPPNTGDLLGMILAWFSLSPIFILVAFITLIIFHRDLHTVMLHTIAGVTRPCVYLSPDILLCWIGVK